MARDQRHSIWKHRGKPLAFKMGVSVPLYLFRRFPLDLSCIAPDAPFASCVSQLLLSIFAANQRVARSRQLYTVGENPKATEVTGMKLKFTFAALLAMVLSLGAWAQNEPQDNGGIKQDTKDAAHSTGKAAKKVGHKVKKGTKKVVHAGAKGTRKGASKVEGKTEPTPTPVPPPQK